MDLAFRFMDFGIACFVLGIVFAFIAALADK